MLRDEYPFSDKLISGVRYQEGESQKMNAQKILCRAIEFFLMRFCRNSTEFIVKLVKVVFEPSTSCSRELLAECHRHLICVILFLL